MDAFETDVGISTSSLITLADFLIIFLRVFPSFPFAHPGGHLRFPHSLGTLFSRSRCSFKRIKGWRYITPERQAAMRAAVFALAGGGLRLHPAVPCAAHPLGPAARIGLRKGSHYTAPIQLFIQLSIYIRAGRPSGRESYRAQSHTQPYTSLSARRWRSALERSPPRSRPVAHLEGKLSHLVGKLSHLEGTLSH